MQWSDVRFDAPSRVLRQFAVLWMWCWRLSPPGSFSPGTNRPHWSYLPLGWASAFPGSSGRKTIRYVYGAARLRHFQSDGLFPRPC